MLQLMLVTPEVLDVGSFRKEAVFVLRPIVRSSPLKRSGMDHTVVTLQTHHTHLYLVAI